MESYINFGCQVCLTQHTRVGGLKKHMISTNHRKKMADIFQKGTFKGYAVGIRHDHSSSQYDNPRSRCYHDPWQPLRQEGTRPPRENPSFFPPIIKIDPDATAKHDIYQQPIIGVSLMTLCFSQDTSIYFYLCHACEEKHPPDRIANHLASIDHFRNYFSYINPNVVNFAWIPSVARRAMLTPDAKSDIREREPARLQLLDLPEYLLKRFQTISYSEVMQTLSENDKLLKVLEDVKPKRTMIQTYQKDSNRKHPLLGMQHLIECIRVGPAEKRYYLCTLCHLTVATHMIIGHVLSFDHIYCYLREKHPSTLLSRVSYQNYNYSFASTMLGFAKQAEEIQNAENTDMKQVSLEPARFTSVNFTCYAQALKKLESIREEDKEGSLITIIKPGNRLVPRTVSAASAASVAAPAAAAAAPAASVVPPATATPATPAATAVTAVGQAAPAKPTEPPGPAAPVALSYKLRCQNCSKHFKSIHMYCIHLSGWKHKQMLNKCFGGGWKPSLDFGHKYLKERLMQNKPLIGLSLVVMCVSSQAQEEPICVCFACKDCFPDSFLKQHLDSTKHLINTLLHQNPWQLPFGWDAHLDLKVLRSAAWEEEKKRGPEQMLLKMFDMPYWEFQNIISFEYPQVMESLHEYRTILTSDVPPNQRFTRFHQNERFPLLGSNFVVMFDVQLTRNGPTEMGFLCMLCERRLSGDECYAHVFSRKHVVKFLVSFHSPDSLNSSTDAETLLDLAKQAYIGPPSHIQEIRLDKPIWEPCHFKEATKILASVKRRCGKGNLKPLIYHKKKLFPRKTQKESCKDHVRDDSQKNSGVMDCCGKTCQKSDTNESTLKKIPVEVGAEVTNTHCVGGGENAKKGDNKETLAPCEKESEEREEVYSKTSLTDIKNAGRETCQAIKEEKTERPTERKPGGETLESCQNVDKKDKTEDGKELSNSSTEVLAQFTQKRKVSQEDTCPAEDGKQEMALERQWVTSKEDTLQEESKDLARCRQKELTTAEKGESGKPSHETANDKAASNTNQQRDQLWQFVKRENQEPVVGLNALFQCNCNERDPIYLCECCSLKIPEKNILSHVTGVDHQRMYSVVVDLDDEIYDNISKQDFKSAIQTVKALRDQQDGGLDLPSTSNPPGVQPEDTSVTVDTQCIVCSAPDHYQVVEMEIDDNLEDSEGQPFSVTAAVSLMTETTSSTTNQPAEVSESADNTDTCLTASRSSDNKAEIISNTTVGPLKMATTSKTVGTPQTAAVSYSTVTTTSTTATSSYTTATTLRETASKRTTASSVCTCTFTATSHPSSSTISSMTSATTSATLSKPLASRTGTAAKVSASAYKAATTPNADFTVRREPIRPTASASKNSEVASKTAVAPMETSVATAKMTKLSVNCGNTGASDKTAHRKNSVGSTRDVAPNVHKSEAPAAPHVTARSENKNPHTEPSHTSARKTDTSNTSFPRVGLSQLISVSCEERRQTYCQLCSARLLKSTHTSGFDHVSRYVNMRYPEIGKSRKAVMEKANYLAEAEKGVKFKSLKVNIDEYRELARLSVDQVFVRLEEMFKQRASQVSSPSVDVWRQQVPSISPCEVWSPDDGIPQNESHSTDNQSEKEKRQELQTHWVQIPEIESSSTEKETLAIDQSDRAQSVKSSEPEADNLISDQLHSCSILKKNEPTANLRTKDAGRAVTGIHHLSRLYLPAAEVEKSQDHDVQPSATDFAGRFTQTPSTCQETLEKRQQRESRDPRFKNTQKVLESFQKTSSPVTDPDPAPPSSAATVNTEQQNQPKPSLTQAEHVPKQSQAPQIGEIIPGCSNLSTYYLKVKGYDRRQILGLGSVWECRGISMHSFYLCESCGVTLSYNDICAHMVSKKHRLNHMQRKYNKFLYFMSDENVSESKKEDILKGVAEMLVSQESHKKMDAQVVLVRPEYYERVSKAPFSEALEMVQNIEKAKNLSVSCPPIYTPQGTDQQPIAQQSPDESLPKEKQPVRALETDQRSDNGARQKTEEHMEETVGDVDGVKQRTVLSPLDMNCVSSNADSVVSPVPGAGTSLSPQEQPEPRAPVPQLQRPVPEVQEKLAEEHSESSSYSITGLKTSQPPSGSPSDNCPPARKRQAVESIETLHRSCTSNPQLEDPFPASSRLGSEQPPITQPSPESVTESVSVNPAATSTLMSVWHKNTGPDAQDTPDPKMVEELKALLRKRRSAVTSNYSSQMPRDGTETSSSGVSQLPINPIVTVRPNTQKQRFVDGFKRQKQTKANRDNQVAHSFATVASVNPADASGGYGRYSQKAHTTNRQSGYFSSEAVGNYTTPNNPPAYSGSSYQCEGHASRELYQSQIYPQQEASHFSVAAPSLPDWARLGMQRQQMLLQEQYSSWTGAPAAENGNMTSEAVYVGAVPFMIPADHSQMLIDVNQYNASRIAPTLNSTNMITQSPSQVYINNPVLYFPAAASPEIMSQASVNSCFASGRGFLP